MSRLGKIFICAFWMVGVLVISAFAFYFLFTRQHALSIGYFSAAGVWTVNVILSFKDVRKLKSGTVLPHQVR